MNMMQCDYPTATLVILYTHLPDIETLLQRFKVEGVYTLNGMKRIVVVFEETVDAISVKGLLGEDAFYLDVGEEAELLEVPGLERNFLISPPGSPCEGWVQQREEGPVAGGWHWDGDVCEMRDGERGDAMDKDAQGIPRIVIDECEEITASSQLYTPTRLPPR